MEPFVTFTAVAAPMDVPNIDTDQIIPARFLRKPRSAGYHNWLFHDLRYKADGVEADDFVLNRPAYRDAKIIVAAENFGCGSSREGAVWALKGAGIRVLVAPSFGDILFNNSLKNGLLPVVLPAADVERLRAQLHDGPGAQIRVDLEPQTLTGPDGAVYGFEIDAFRKACLLEGQDDIGITLSYADAIDGFERRHLEEQPWVAPAA